MRFAYGVKYLRFNRKTNIMTPIGGAVNVWDQTPI
jgi:hypothetical protein